MDQDVTWYGGIGLGPGNTVLDGDTASPQQGGSWGPQFLAYVCCGQTAEWNKMTLGMEVGLGPGHIVLDMGTQVPSPKRDTAPSPIFCPSLLWPFWPNG